MVRFRQFLLALAGMLALLAAGTLPPARVLSPTSQDGLNPQLALTVNGHPISIELYDVLVQGDQVQLDHRERGVNWLSDRGSVLLRDIEADVLRRLVSDEVVGQLAHQHHVDVSDTALNQAISQLEVVFGSRVAFQSELASEGLDLAEFRVFYRYQLLQDGLERIDGQYGTDVERALAGANVSVFVAPCARLHRFPACLSESLPASQQPELRVS